jgi:lipoyl-dependent peroxiredoxin
LNTNLKLEKVVYTAKVHTTGGRENGASRSDDGRLDIKLSRPAEPGTGTNPEQLFAAAWSACFLSAIKFMAGRKKIALSDEVAINIEVDEGTIGCSYAVAARLNVHLPGVEHEAAHALVEAAHLICPYSKATRGNIDVVTNIV